MNVDLFNLVSTAKYNLNLKTGKVVSITLIDVQADFMVRVNIDTANFFVEIAHNSPLKMSLNQTTKQMLLIMAKTYEMGYSRGAF